MKRPRVSVSLDVVKTAHTNHVQQCEFLSKDLKNLPVDVTITLDGGERIQCNRMLLGARSPVFRAMFKSEMREASADTIKVSDIDAETLNGVLEWLSSCDYVETVKLAHQKAAEARKTAKSGEKEKNGEGDNSDHDDFYSSPFFKRRMHLKAPVHYLTAFASTTASKNKDFFIPTNLLLKILMAANRFDMPDLTSLCVEDIKPDLTSSSACEVLKIAALIEHADLKKHCINYIFENRIKIGSKGKLSSLPHELLVQVLQAPRRIYVQGLNPSAAARIPLPPRAPPPRAPPPQTPPPPM